MDHVEQALRELEQQQKAPVEDAKKALALTRAAAEKALRESKTLATTFGPRWQAMQNRANRAIRALGWGGLPISLKEYLTQGLGDGEGRVSLLTGAPASFEDIIRRIDGLSEWDFVQGIHHRLPGDLQAKLANLGAFEALHHKIEQEVKSLENVATEKAGSAAQATAISVPPVAERPDGLKVESKFDPRG